MRTQLQGYVREPISNGNPNEQALIRQWWHETHGERGEIVWEYHVQGLYIDAVWFKESENHGKENPGFKTASLFPLSGRKVILCEAKIKLNPELIGQALVYSELAKRAGAKVESSIVFCEMASPLMVSVADSLGLEVVATGAQPGHALKPRSR